MSRQPSGLQLWILAIRPKTLPAAAPPVLVGSAMAWLDRTFLLLPALAAFVCALLLQVAVNLANDYFDAKHEIDSEQRLGPLRVTQSGLIPAARVKGAMLLCLAAAGIIFLYLAWVGGPAILIVGFASLLAALAYSGGPYPLASNGLGEVFVFLFFGLVGVCTTYYIQAGQLGADVVIASVAPGLLITAILVVNNLRDIATDGPAGKNTLAVRLGPERTILLYRVLLGVSYIFPLILILRGRAGGMVLLVLASLPLARSLWREIGRVTGAGLNETLARTAKLSLLFNLLFSLGLVF